MNKIYFSARKNTFFFESMKSIYEDANSWPDDPVEVTQDTYRQYAGEQPPAGKVRGSDVSGLPAWVDIPPLTTDELIVIAEAEKQRRLTVANAKIMTLSDAIELDMATDAERQLYDAWRRYRVLLTRVDTAAAPVNWPPSPAE